MKNKFGIKHLMMVFMAFTLLFGTVSAFAPDYADAKRGGFKSGTKSYTNTPKKSDNNVSQSNSNNNSTTGASTTNRGGFFGGGGGFMKGMMLGGLAGMLFGGLFGGMGFLGNILGLLVNVIAIVAIVMLAMALFRAIANRRKPVTHGRYDSRDDRDDDRNRNGRY